MIGDHHHRMPGEQLCWSGPWTGFSARTGGCVHEGPDFAIGWRAFQPGEAFPAHIHEHFEEVFIATGTPWEAGTARTPPLCLVPGDLVEVEITGVGELSNTVVDEDDNESLSPA
jgi:Fumarylacetoacetate (FAA) hydrolase family